MMFFFFFLVLFNLAVGSTFFVPHQTGQGKGYAHEKHLVRAKQGPDVLQSVQCRLVRTRHKSEQN